jgi:DNA-binding NarL/FixJ family response regulator
MSLTSKDRPRLLLLSGPGVIGDCLNCFLGRMDHVHLVGRFQTVSETLAVIPGCQPTLIVVDLWNTTAQTSDLVRSIKTRWPSQGCLVLADSFSQAEIAQSQGAEILLFWPLWPDKLAAKIERLITTESALPTPDGKRCSTKRG